MDGILVVDKPQGLTSHDVVDFIRKRFGFTKVGHAGTLDPIATGVLVILIGKCTKLSNSIMSQEKVYEAALTMGGTSDTADAWGNVVKNDVKLDIGRDEITAAFNKFVGETEQRPPMYSAVKHNGRKLYELARKGISVEIAPRKIVIKSIKISKIDLPEVFFEVDCSKGTYIRQLCVDVGEVLGCGAYLSRLRRTRSGSFDIGQAVNFEELKTMNADDLGKRFISHDNL